MRTLAAAFAISVAASLAVDAQPREPTSPPAGRNTWTETKCIRYKAAWGELVKQRGVDGIGPEFLSRHDSFIAQGCRNSTHVCPRSDAELEVADMMVIAALNGGMASTFPPFSCER